MADNIIDGIHCGQIFILSNNNFALICEFCGREDLYTLDVFRSHVKKHFPDSEDEVCISSDSECEFVKSDIPEVTKVQLATTLQNDEACGSQTTGAENLLIEREWVPATSDSDGSSQSEHSARNQSRRKRRKRPHTIPSTSSIANVEDGSQTTMICTEQLRTLQSINHNDNIRTEDAVASNGLDELNEIRLKNFGCGICHKLFSSNSYRRQHEDTHSGKPNKCQLCNKTFSTRYSLYRHVKLMHTIDRQHSCSFCDKRFHIYSLLERHVRENHLPDSDPRRYFNCNQCDGKFKTFHLLSTHKPCRSRK